MATPSSYPATSSNGSKPLTKATAPQTAIGYVQATGTNGGYWWLYDNETTPELQWPQSVYVYDQMRRQDAQVTSMLRAVTLPVLRTQWRVDPAGARDEVVQLIAQDLGLPIVGQNPTPAPRTGDRFSWPDHLRQALLMIVYGYAYFEQVYRVDKDGNRAHLRKLEPRPQTTIDRIDVAHDGGLIQIWQRWATGEGPPRPIPVDRLVCYVNEKEGGNWLGRSLLRPAYKNWVIKDRLLRVQAQTIERNGMGVPLYIGQEGASADDLAAGKAMASAWRSGEAAGSSIPFGAQLLLKGVDGTLPDADPAIRYHDEQIARAVLAHFLNLGTQTGSWALGSTFADFFTLSLQTLAQAVADTATCYIVEDLVDINWGPEEPAPRIVFDEIGARPDAAAIATLLQSGAIVADETLEATIRQQYGLPPAEPRPPATDQPPPDQGYSETPLYDDGATPVQASAAGHDADPGKFAEEDLTDDELVEVLVAAISGAEPVAATAPFNPALHPRGTGGKFRTVLDRIRNALDQHAQGGPGDPLKAFTPRQLSETYKKLTGHILHRGATGDDYKAALIALHAQNQGRLVPVHLHGVTTQQRKPSFALSSESHVVYLHGQDVGHIEKAQPGWYAYPPTNSSYRLPGGGKPYKTQDEATKALLDAHHKSDALHADIAIRPISTSAIHGDVDAVEYKGTHIGQLNRNPYLRRDISAQDANGYFLYDKNGNALKFDTEDEALEALVEHMARTAPVAIGPPRPVSPRVAGAPGVTVTPVVPLPGMFGPAKESLRVEVNGTHVGYLHHWSYGWHGDTVAGNPVSVAAKTTYTDTLKALVAPHVPPPSAPDSKPRLQKLPHAPAGATEAHEVSVGGTPIGIIQRSSTGTWFWAQYGGGPPSGGHSLRKDAVAGLVAAHAASSIPAPPKPTVNDPAVQAALEVVYGVDPKANTAARQLSAYGGLRASQFSALDGSHQHVILGDLTYIAATSKGPNATKARTLVDRFTPPGTPPGTIPKQAVLIPAGAASAQDRYATPKAGHALLKVVPSAQRGANGDGRPASTGNGRAPWGKYGSAGLLLRHVDSKGTSRYLMVQRGPGISDPGMWQFPGGAKDEREDFFQGAARETMEEIGLTAVDMGAARIHGTHTFEDSSVQVPGLHGGTVPWAYVSIAADVDQQLKPDLSSHHARLETADAKWMTEAEIRQLDQDGKLLAPLAGGQLQQNVMSLFPPANRTAPGKPSRPNRLGGPVPIVVGASAHKPSSGRNLVADAAAQGKLNADVDRLKRRYSGKSADGRLAAIGQLQGYDDTPTVVSKAEMDRLLATGDYEELWRGVNSSNGKTAAQIHEEMRSGPAYYGRGIFGNGYYLTPLRDVAINSYSDRSKGSLMRVLVPKVAKTEDYPSVHAKAKAAASNSSHTYADDPNIDIGTLRDPGRFAAAAGLDGVAIPQGMQGHGFPGSGHITAPGRPAYNWLNRSVLIIQEADA